MLDMIKTSSTQLSSLLEPLNIAPQANEVLAKPSTDLILLKGLKRI